MGQAIAEGARETGAQADVKRVPETAPAEIARAAVFKLDQVAHVTTVAELESYDAIVVGVGTRSGRMASQMAAFLDQAGPMGARRTARQGRRRLHLHRHQHGGRRPRCSRSSPTSCTSA
jgi:NAD(P)H dehydrogenase (quinone)